MPPRGRGGRFGLSRSFGRDPDVRCPYEEEQDDEDELTRSLNFPYYHKLKFPPSAFQRLAKVKASKAQPKGASPSLDDIFDVEVIEKELIKSLKGNNTYLMYQPNEHKYPLSEQKQHRTQYTEWLFKEKPQLFPAKLMQMTKKPVRPPTKRDIEKAQQANKARQAKAIVEKRVQEAKKPTQMKYNIVKGSEIISKSTLEYVKFDG